MSDVHCVQSKEKVMRKNIYKNENKDMFYKSLLFYHKLEITAIVIPINQIAIWLNIYHTSKYASNIQRIIISYR